MVKLLCFIVLFSFAILIAKSVPKKRRPPHGDLQGRVKGRKTPT
jgi:hypothetical protein